MACILPRSRAWARAGGQILSSARVRLRPTAASALFRDGRLQLAGTLQHCTAHITSLPVFFTRTVACILRVRGRLRTPALFTKAQIIT